MRLLSMGFLLVSLVSAVLGQSSCAFIREQPEIPYQETISLRLEEGQTLLITDADGEVVSLQFDGYLRAVSGSEVPDLYTWSNDEGPGIIVYFNQGLIRENHYMYEIE